MASRIPFEEAQRRVAHDKAILENKERMENQTKVKQALVDMIQGAGSIRNVHVEALSVESVDETGLWKTNTPNGEMVLTVRFWRQ
jgi:hypothetical protein